jgi:hypothetical protein
MIVAQLVSIVMYFASMFILRTYFDVTFLLTSSFGWKVSVITTVSCVPPALLRALWKYVGHATAYIAIPSPRVRSNSCDLMVVCNSHVLKHRL